VVDPVVEPTAADGEGPDDLAGKEGLLLSGDEARIVEIGDSFRDHFGMDADVPGAAVRQEPQHRVRQAADAHLEGGPVLGDQLGDVTGDLLFHRCRLGGGDGDQLVRVVLDDVIDFGDMNAFVVAAVTPGHILHDLDDDDLGPFENGLLEVAQGTEVEVPVLIHGGDDLDGDVHVEAVPVIACRLAEIVGDVGPPVFGDVLPRPAQDVPVADPEALRLRVLLHDLQGRQMTQGADLDVLHFADPLGQRAIKGPGRLHRAVVHPHAVPNQGSDLLGRG